MHRHSLLRSHELNRVPRDLSGSPKKKKRNPACDPPYITGSESLTACFSFFRASRSVLLSSFKLDRRIECADSSCGRSFYGGPPVEEQTNSLSILSPILLSLSRARVGDRDGICMRSHAASNWRRGLGNPPPFVPTNVWMQGAWSTPLSCRCNEHRAGIPTLSPGA